MNAQVLRPAGITLLVAAAGMAAGAQPRDPRIGLRGGLRDAAQASRNMTLIASLPKPDGFFDPTSPAGIPTPPERPPAATTSQAASPNLASTDNPPAQPAPARANEPPRFDAAAANRLSFSNSDLAFSGTRLFAGNYHGFNAYNIEDGKNPRLLASIVCPGGQGDVSVHGNLLFMSVEQTRGRVDCGTGGVPTAVSAERFRGVRIFDITDVRNPRQVAAVQTCRGSHTHTLVNDPDDAANLYVYGSGTGAVRSAEELADCSGKDPKEDPNTAFFSIDVIQVPLAAPEQARIVNRPRIFADPATGAISGLWPGGDHGPGTQTTRLTNQCHDITVFAEVGLAAGACAGNGILMDISDPVHPVRLDHVVDKNFAYWHSATFNNDGTKIVFTDEWGGGTRPRCRATDLPTWGADAIFDIVDRKLRFASYYKMPAPQTDQENCVAHNGSIVPVPGRDIMVQAWYQGGISVFDFTDSAHPVEIAFFDRGPVDPANLITAGYWSTYWYNGNIYGAEIARGLDVFRLEPSEFLSQNEIAAAVLVHATSFNAQQQTRIGWPDSSLVARAYLDQLGRTRGIQGSRVSAVRNGLERAERFRAGEKNPEHAARLDALATALKGDASSAGAIDAKRLLALAGLVQRRADLLR
jgi:hypothetical protein